MIDLTYEQAQTTSDLHGFSIQEILYVMTQVLYYLKSVCSIIFKRYEFSLDWCKLSVESKARREVESPTE